MNKQDLIKKIKDLTDISNDEKAYLIELVNTKKKYGLVWEDKPEDVEEQLRSMLPVFKEVKERAIISENTDAPNHILIEGDNLHALTALTYTHEGKVDVIYIDPPYNTGNKDFIYNDSYVDKEDTYRHSKWLSFMDKRLRLAKKLLSEKGVIFISIDDNEQSQLKLLCDEIFGESNFISNLIWEQGRKSMSSFVAVNHEYCLIYSKSKSQLGNYEKLNKNNNWKEKKKGLDEIYKEYEKLKKFHKDSIINIQNDLRSFYRNLPDDHPAKYHKHYKCVDNKGIYFPGDIAQGTGKGGTFNIYHPVTKKPCKVPRGGWRFSEDKLPNMLLEEKIHFGADENTIPCIKRYLKETEYEVVSSVFYKDGRGASARLTNLLGINAFDYPKDEDIIKKFLTLSNSYYKSDSIILDFFAGSGTTLHATMALNEEDGGNRQCILVTNNENKIAEEVTYERNKRVIEGYTNAKGEQVEGLTNNNLRYYQADFVPSERTEMNRRLLTARSTELLCIKENCFIDKTKDFAINEKQAKLFSNGLGKYMVVVYHTRNQEEVIDQLSSVISGLETTEKVKVYAFSPEKEIIEDDFYKVADKITAVPLPDSIYNAYRATFRTLKLDKKEAVSSTTNQEA